MLNNKYLRFLVNIDKRADYNAKQEQKQVYYWSSNIQNLYPLLVKLLVSWHLCLCHNHKVNPIFSLDTVGPVYNSYHLEKVSVKAIIKAMLLITKNI